MSALRIDNSIQQKFKHDNPPVPLSGGSTAAIFGDRLIFSNRLSKSIAFQQTSVLKLLAAGVQSLFVMIKNQKRCKLPPPPHLFGSLHRAPSCKFFNSQTCFQGTKKTDKLSRRPPETQTRDSGTMRMPKSPYEMFVAILSIRKPCFKSPWRPYVDSKLDKKQYFVQYHVRLKSKSIAPILKKMGS